MLLYLCEKCHKWQDVSIQVFLTDTWNNAIKGVPSAKIPEPTSYPCPNGCGMMVQVKPEDKVTLFKQDVDICVDGKPVNKYSKPPVGSWDDWDKRVKTQHRLLEEMYKVLLEYVETFPREHELRDKAYPLINCVYENLKEWDDNILASEKETSKKQEESTALFDVIGRAVLQHSGKKFDAQSNDGIVLAAYRVIDNNWSLVSADEKPVEIDITKDELQSIAEKHKINLSKGWKLVNVSGIRG